MKSELAHIAAMIILVLIAVGAPIWICRQRLEASRARLHNCAKLQTVQEARLCAAGL